MNCELNGLKIKYEDGKLWREMSGNEIVKKSYWREMKGSVHKITGYRIVKINYKAYQYHRVVYFIHNQEWKIHDISMSNHIDHIDRNRLNNSIENLRVVTHLQNAWNQYSKGYCINKCGNYQAQIGVNGGVKYLGTFKNPEDARQAYLEAKKIYHPYINGVEEIEPRK